MPRKTSKREKRCGQVLKQMFEGWTFVKVRPDWLKNPDTGRNLELDFYCEELGLAVEYNGAQHYKISRDFVRTEEQLAAQQRRDAHKLAICEQLGIRLIVVPYTVRTRKAIEKHIREHLNQ